jgi:ribosomal protein S18 acetylase RimI-like enzyme
MELRPATPADTDAVLEIDGTVESHRYLHVEQAGEGLDVRWSVQDRPLRERLIQPRPMDDEQRFAFRQFVNGIEDDGVATVAVHDGSVVGLLMARADGVAGVLRVLDLRVDFEQRREGLATGMLYAAVAAARAGGLRAIAADVPANNGPAAALLAKLGFTLAGLDTQRWSTHDLVKETVTLFWYLALD